MMGDGDERKEIPRPKYPNLPNIHDTDTCKNKTSNTPLCYPHSAVITAFILHTPLPRPITQFQQCLHFYVIECPWFAAHFRYYTGVSFETWTVQFRSEVSELIAFNP